MVIFGSLLFLFFLAIQFLFIQQSGFGLMDPHCINSVFVEFIKFIFKFHYFGTTNFQARYFSWEWFRNLRVKKFDKISFSRFFFFLLFSCRLL